MKTGGACPAPKTPSQQQCRGPHHLPGAQCQPKSLGPSHSSIPMHVGPPLAATGRRLATQHPTVATPRGGRSHRHHQIVRYRGQESRVANRHRGPAMWRHQTLQVVPPCCGQCAMPCTPLGQPSSWHTAQHLHPPHSWHNPTTTVPVRSQLVVHSHGWCLCANLLGSPKLGIHHSCHQCNRSRKRCHSPPPPVLQPPWTARLRTCHAAFVRIRFVLALIRNLFGPQRPTTTIPARSQSVVHSHGWSPKLGIHHSCHQCNRSRKRCHSHLLSQLPSFLQAHWRSMLPLPISAAACGPYGGPCPTRLPKGTVHGLGLARHQPVRWQLVPPLHHLSPLAGLNYLANHNVSARAGCKYLCV